MLGFPQFQPKKGPEPVLGGGTPKSILGTPRFQKDDTCHLWGSLGPLLFEGFPFIAANKSVAGFSLDIYWGVRG